MTAIGRGLTRRSLLKAGGVGAVGVAALGAGGCFGGEEEEAAASG